MEPTTIRSPPSLGDFTSLAEHLTQTPSTFYGGKPVLHYHATGAKAWIPKSQLGSLPFFPADLESEVTAPEGAALNGTSEESVEQKVDIYVSSQTFTIFCPAAESGLSIPYPLISIHAIKTIGGAHQSVYLQLELSEGNGGDDDFETVELTLIPTPSSTTATTTTTTPAAAVPAEALEATKLFAAISECSNLNPDPVDQDDSEDGDEDDRIVFEADHRPVEGFSGVFVGAENGGLPPPMPGSSGWITAENVHEFFDADGNWIGGGDAEEVEVLGEGAGVVHGRDEDEGGVEGEGGENAAAGGAGDGMDVDSKRVRRD
ncbi:regulator of volume decrease after cellular swelling-domain-containing protein [Bombardia bombarda]|uniref:Regulator of volume decrease after cellular swelling-domain-containing protein n=1 Tax=Bombardia bombarda TaxID=252184 RepID=A0AA39XLI2_9PEZI|nr:regulator of volume decrease after cellular swelling-domain-containing protein [Bombardia bombarda]